MEIIRINTRGANAYIVINDASSFIVDTGRKGASKKVLKTARENGLKPSDIKMIFLTHTHYDHTGSLHALKKETGAVVIVHESEAPFLVEGASPLPRGTIFPTKIISSLGRGPLKNIGKFDPVEPDLTFEEEMDLSKYEIEGRILHTPGHTKGSSMLLLDDGNCFTGDAMFNIFPRSVYPPFADDEEQLTRTWKRIREMRIERFHPGHGKPFGRERFLRSIEKKG